MTILHGRVQVNARGGDVRVTELVLGEFHVPGLAHGEGRIAVAETVGILPSRDPGLGQQHFYEVGERPLTHASPVLTV